jgi:hypothetical protein
VATQHLLLVRGAAHRAARCGRARNRA